MWNVTIKIHYYRQRLTVSKSLLISRELYSVHMCLCERGMHVYTLKFPILKNRSAYCYFCTLYTQNDKMQENLCNFRTIACCPFARLVHGMFFLSLLMVVVVMLLLLLKWCSWNAWTVNTLNNNQWIAGHSGAFANVCENPSARAHKQAYIHYTREKKNGIV